MKFSAQRSRTEGSSTGQGDGRERLPTVGFLLFFSLTLFWGGNWPIMKIALGEIPPWTFRTLCLLLGGFGLLALVKAKGLPLTVPAKDAGRLLVVALTNVTGWHMLSAHGVMLMSAGRASIVAFTMPLWAAILGRFLLNEKLNKWRVTGLGLGLLGLGILIGSDVRALGHAPKGAAFMLAAAVSWALGTVFMKAFRWTIPISVLTGWQLLLGGIPVLLGALVLEPATVIFQISTQVLLAMAYIILFPTVFCQWAWFKILHLFPASVATVGTLMIPIIGVFSSALLLGEPVGLQELSALALIVAALAMVLFRLPE